MTYEEAMAYITPHPSSNVIQLTGNDLREAVKAIKAEVQKLEAQIDDMSDELANAEW